METNKNEFSKEELHVARQIMKKIRLIQEETGWGTVSVIIQDKKVKVLDFKGTEKIQDNIAIEKS